jgi:hypothetical protein
MNKIEAYTQTKNDPLFLLDLVKNHLKVRPSQNKIFAQLWVLQFASHLPNAYHDFFSRLREDAYIRRPVVRRLMAYQCACC